MGIISIRGPAAGVVAGIFREKLREEKRMTKRGPKVTVAKARRTKKGKTSVWKCYLKCGHHVYRPVKRRKVLYYQNPEDPAPSWVYCELCADDESTGRYG